MSNVLKAACIQVNGRPALEENLELVGGMIREAAGQGARLIVTPENTCHMHYPLAARLKTSRRQEEHPALPFYADMARELGVWILIGSLLIKVSEDKVANRSFLFSDTGEIISTYDKIHLFDVDLPNGERYRESEIIKPGDQAVVADTPWGKLGMSICYDVRFPHLYRDLAKVGAVIMAVPAAFSMPTGEAHWKTLVRARAIETGSFVLAPGQAGEHEGGRSSWGHSLIVGPWGEVLAEGREGSEILLSDLDLDEVAKARQAIPALAHDMKYTVRT